MSQETSIKFQCKQKDLINAMGKYAGIKNVLVASSGDAEGAVRCLLAIIDSGAEHPCNVGSIACETYGEGVSIRLVAEDSMANKTFLEGIKKLQELISSENKQ